MIARGDGELRVDRRLVLADWLNPQDLGRPLAGHGRHEAPHEFGKGRGVDELLGLRGIHTSGDGAVEIREELRHRRIGRARSSRRNDSVARDLERGCLDGVICGAAEAVHGLGLIACRERDLTKNVVAPGRRIDRNGLDGKSRFRVGRRLRRSPEREQRSGVPGLVARVSRIERNGLLERLFSRRIVLAKQRRHAVGKERVARRVRGPRIVRVIRLGYDVIGIHVDGDHALGGLEGHLPEALRGHT